MAWSLFVRGGDCVSERQREDQKRAKAKGEIERTFVCHIEALIVRQAIGAIANCVFCFMPENGIITGSVRNIVHNSIV